MKKLLPFVFVLLIPLLISSTGTETSVNFYKGSLITAKAKAKAENRPIVIEFMASWCGPCHIMDQYVFTNASLANYIADNYLPIKIDVDDFDGYAYKEQYNISVVPSFVVLDPQGNYVAKKEGSMTISDLRDFLENQDRWTPVATTYTPEPEPITEPEPTHTSTPSHTPKPDTSPSSVGIAAGLFRFSVKPEVPTGYSVQIGVYAQYGNVLREVSKFEKMFNKPILVHIDRLYNKTVYRVMVGNFSSYGQAAAFNREVAANNIEGLVKDLSTFQ